MELAGDDVLGIPVVLVIVFVIVDVILPLRKDGEYDEDGWAIVKLRVLVALARLIR